MKKNPKTYMEILTGDSKFKKMFKKEYEKLDALAAKEKGKEKRVTKRFISNLKHGRV